MTEKIEPLTDTVELRRRAEDRLRVKTADVQPSLTTDDALRLVHELEVHRIELEMQNLELRRSREEVESTLEKFTDLYDFSPVGYLTLNRDGAIRAVNLTGACLMGVERTLLINRNFRHFVDAADRPGFSAFLDTVFTGRGKETFEAALRTEDNSPLIVQMEALADTSEQECRIAVIDITGRKRAEGELRQEKEASRELRQVNESAEAIARTKGQFLTNMSHELRTPMTGILGMLELALEDDLAPATRGYLDTSLKSARSLLAIINDILDMARIEAGRLAIAENPFSPRECISEAVDIITPEVHRKGLDLTLSVAEDLPDTAAGDHARLRQVLLNLISNAVKFTEKGIVAIHVSSGRTISAGKRQFTFSVSDSGIGIPDDKKALLFKAFSQVDASLSRSFGGTGLGLVISREIVELMGGSISCESAEGVGSTFTITIPLGVNGLADIPRSAITSLSPGTVTLTAGEKIPHLLFAEDDPATRQVFGSLIKMATNYTLDFATDGLKAIEMWEKGDYDLVLMDIQMPHLDGIQAIRVIREKERIRGGGRTPIVAMTAHDVFEDEKMCRAAGMDAYLSKPIDINMCLLLIEKLVRQGGSGEG